MNDAVHKLFSGGDFTAVGLINCVCRDERIIKNDKERITVPIDKRPCMISPTEVEPAITASGITDSNASVT